MSPKRGFPRPPTSPQSGGFANRRHNPDALRISWGRWTEVVELYALRHQGRCRVDPRAYQDLYQIVIKACQSEGPTPVDRQKFEALVRPWMSLRVLAGTDREILSHLLVLCRQFEQELGGRRHATLIPLLKILFVTTVFVGCSLLLWYARGFLFSAADFLQSWWATGRLAFQTAGEREAIYAGGIVITLASIYVISRRPRN